MILSSEEKDYIKVVLLTSWYDFCWDFMVSIILTGSLVSIVMIKLLLKKIGLRKHSD